MDVRGRAVRAGTGDILRETEGYWNRFQRAIGSAV
jgi:hypothetical protein